MLASDELTTVLSPTGLTVLTKRTAPMSIDLSTEQVAAADVEQRLAVVKSLLDVYAKSGNSDSFRAIQDGDVIHIIQTDVRGPDGTKEPFESILSTRISFPERHFADMYLFLDEVIREISQIREIPIVLGTMPKSFRQSSVIEFADNEPASQVLERAFVEINGPRLAVGLYYQIFTWDLVYDATDRRYWLNITQVRI